ncbi:FecR domain-containing protein [Pseudorhodoferax sp.]|uniref:FecR domain-containing protein n=1 Tax=Pseudorhodoferax sp. TaxID=1993553 RepID=UPI0039E3FEC6
MAVKPCTAALRAGLAEPPARPSVQSLEQAAQWYATLRDENAAEADRAAWRAWLAHSPQNQSAWAHIESVSRRFEPLRGHGPQGTAAAVAGVAAARSTVAPRRRQALGTAAGVLGVGVLTWLGWRHLPMPERVVAWRADHRTGVGERRDVVLGDGSRIWLNTGSAMQVDYQASQRRLVLLDGEILVRTAADRLQRPFYVGTRHGQLQALGTRFTVRQAADRTRLDVFEGAVEIRTQAGKALRVQAGRAATFDAQAISALEDADRLREAWSRGKLPADDMPLGALLEELGRYRHGHISVARDVAGLKVSGVYPTDDVERALSMLEQTLPIRVRRTLPWWTTVEAR